MGSFNYFFPLQSLQMFQIETSPTNTLLFILFFVILVGVFVFLSVSKKVQQSKLMQDNTMLASARKRHPKGTGLAKVVRQYELKKDEIEFLQDLFDDYNTDVASTFASRASINRAFAEFYKKIVREAKDETEQKNNLLKLFTIANTIYYFESARDARMRNEFTRRAYMRKACAEPVATRVGIVTEVEGREGLKKVITLKVSENKSYCNMLDISMRGCALNSAAVIKPKTKIKLEFDLNKKHIAALGEVIRAKSTGTAYTLHVKFIKLSTDSIVNLNVYVLSL
jgi:uncharacterized membrane-anchored protein YhcB (DUF1043 family)